MSYLLPEQTISPTNTGSPLLQPAQDVFARHSKRFRHLSQDHSLGPWLNDLAAISDIQQTALDQLASRPFDWFEHVQPAELQNTPSVLAKVALVYDMLASQRHAATAASPGLTAATPAPVLSEDELKNAVTRNCDLAQGHVNGSGRGMTDLMVAAAMQVVWAAVAQQVKATNLNPSNSELCPVCGSAAVGSIVLAGEGKSGLRFQHCCLCASRWHVVRAHCTLCEDGSKVQYLSLQDKHPAIAAETCEHCHGYAKISFQDKDLEVDPIADDLATLALDVLVGEEGFGRAAPNLLLCEGEGLGS
jgi:FdhE protein